MLIVRRCIRRGWDYDSVELWRTSECVSGGIRPNWSVCSEWSRRMLRDAVQPTASRGKNCPKKLSTRETPRDSIWRHKVPFFQKEPAALIFYFHFYLSPVQFCLLQCGCSVEMVCLVERQLFSFICWPMRIYQQWWISVRLCEYRSTSNYGISLFSSHLVIHPTSGLTTTVSIR